MLRAKTLSWIVRVGELHQPGGTPLEVKIVVVEMLRTLLVKGVGDQARAQLAGAVVVGLDPTALQRPRLAVELKAGQEMDEARDGLVLYIWSNSLS
jgi:hypothetical protein